MNPSLDFTNKNGNLKVRPQIRGNWGSIHLTKAFSAFWHVLGYLRHLPGAARHELQETHGSSGTAPGGQAEYSRWKCLEGIDMSICGSVGTYICVFESVSRIPLLVKPVWQVYKSVEALDALFTCRFVWLWVVRFRQTGAQGLWGLSEALGSLCMYRPICTCGVGLAHPRLVWVTIRMWLGSLCMKSSQETWCSTTHNVACELGYGFA